MPPLPLGPLLKSSVRTVRDWPKVGANFRDVAPLFHDPELFRGIVETLAQECASRQADLIAAVDARGFIVGGAIAYQLHRPFVLVRKKGKLPAQTLSEDFAHDFGSAAVEVHADACRPGDRVFIVDDLIATGSTLLAATRLFRALHGEVVGVGSIVDLVELGGSRRLREAGLAVRTLCEFTERE